MMFTDPESDETNYIGWQLALMLFYISDCGSFESLMSLDSKMPKIACESNPDTPNPEAQNLKSRTP